MHLAAIHPSRHQTTGWCFETVIPGRPSQIREKFQPATNFGRSNRRWRSFFAASGSTISIHTCISVPSPSAQSPARRHSRQKQSACGVTAGVHHLEENIRASIFPQISSGMTNVPVSRPATKTPPSSPACHLITRAFANDHDGSRFSTPGWRGENK